jgi:hypothetical protein
LNTSGWKSLHTGEVVGSIPTAPTIKSPVKSAFTAPQRFGPLGSFRQKQETTLRLVENSWTLFPTCSVAKRRRETRATLCQNRWQQKSPARTKPSGAVSRGGGTQTPRPRKRSVAARGCARRRPRVPSSDQGAPAPYCHMVRTRLRKPRSEVLSLRSAFARGRS